MKVKPSEIRLDLEVSIRQKLDEETIKEYMESFENLPSITVFDTEEGLLLVDGFHRKVAAERLGKSSIEVEVKKGSRNEALEHAVTANLKHGKPLTSEERIEGIRRLKFLHPEWPPNVIAKTMNCTAKRVMQIMEAEEVGRAVPEIRNLSTNQLSEIYPVSKMAWRPLTHLVQREGWSGDKIKEIRNSPEELEKVTQAYKVIVQVPNASHDLKIEQLAEIGKLEETEREIAVRKTERKGWSEREIKAIVESPPEYRKKVYSDEAEPLTEKEGEPAYYRETFERKIEQGLKESLPRNQRIAVTDSLESLSHLSNFSPVEIIDALDEFLCQRIVKDLPYFIEFLNQVIMLAKERLEIV